MSLVYAKSDDLKTWMGVDAAPANADALLRSASRLVTRAIRGALFDTDTTGLPTGAVQLQATNDAACAQAAAWSSNSIDPLKGGLPQDRVVQKSLGDASVRYSDFADNEQARHDLASGKVLTAEAWSILEEAGLTSSRVRAQWSDVQLHGVLYDPLSGEQIGRV